MGKRSEFVRKPRDFYPTPFKCIEPLRKILRPEFTFCEPCAGNGALIHHLEEAFDATCFFSIDLEPQEDWILQGDANNLNAESLEYCDWIITNPPFTWSVLRPLMDKWISLKPTLLLLPADFMHNQRFQPYLTYCTAIISIGRVKWIEDSKMSGMENYAWYMFDKNNTQNTIFIGRSS